MVWFAAIAALRLRRGVRRLRRAGAQVWMRKGGLVEVGMLGGTVLRSAESRRRGSSVPWMRRRVEVRSR